MNILKSPQGYRPPEAFFEGIQNNPQNNFQKVQKALGRGIVEGLGAVRNAVNGNVTIEIGFAFDYLGRVINVDADFVLDFSGITRPAAGSFRYVTAVADYNQVEEGAIQDDLGNSYWQEKQESIAIRFIEGDEAASEAAAIKPAVDSGDVVLVDMMFDNASSGCLSIDMDRRTFALLDRIAPVGQLYFQYPFMPTPDAHYSFGSWLNISSRAVGYGISDVNNGDPTSYINRGEANQKKDFSEDDFEIGDQISGGDYDSKYIRTIETYSGLFFRVDGGLASTFNTGGQDEEVGPHSHSINIYAAPDQNEYYQYNAGGKHGAYASFARGSVNVNTNGGTQNVPVNDTIRIWIRKA